MQKKKGNNRCKIRKMAELRKLVACEGTEKVVLLHCQRANDRFMMFATTDLVVLVQVHFCY